MHRAPTCPHGPHQIHPPGPWSSAWTCPEHGHVHPLQPPGPPKEATLAAVVAAARVPVWLPRPMPTAWLLAGATYAGDERTGGRATVVACSGPNPLGGPADLLLVAEEPGVGLGARYAGLSTVDPGGDVGLRSTDAQVRANGHDAPLWCVRGDEGRAVYVGEAAGLWLWVVLEPEGAGTLLAENLMLVDLRTAPTGALGFGALSPMLA
ncbi:MAG: hypothetical protein GEV07_06645 [Streptosporangiales bacterium]|nr:hypothetical protein [Streptosporangiales bacterium]